MLNLIVISATVLILVAMFLYVSVKKMVKTENGKVLITKSVFSNEYKIKPEGGVVIPGLMSGLVVDASPRIGGFSIHSNCMNGTGTVLINVSYTYGFNLSSNITRDMLSSMTSVSSILSDMIKSEINSVISKMEFSEVASTHGELSERISEEINSKVSSLIEGVVLRSMNIDFSDNYASFNKVFEKVDPVVAVDRISNARKNAEEEIEIGKINLDKAKKLNEIEIEKSKEDNEKEVKLKELEIQKYSRISAKRKEAELKEKESEEKDNLRLVGLETESQVKSIQDSKRIEMEKLSSELEIKSKKKEIEMADIDNKLEVAKHKYDVEKQLHSEEVERKNRELELTIDLPAKAEAKKLKMMAENKAEIKKIDTNSSIESSRLKIEYKKEESAIIAKIKDGKDSADLNLYKRMIEVAASNPELAIQWKKIESEVEAIRIKSESLSKLPLESLIINGAGSELADVLSLTSNSNKDESKSTKDSKKK